MIYLLSLLVAIVAGQKLDAAPGGIGGDTDAGGGDSGPCECIGDARDAEIPGNHPFAKTDNDVGKYCKAWDETSTLCKPDDIEWSLDNELWCHNEWCYVQEGCWVTYEGRNYTGKKTAYFEGWKDENGNVVDVDLWYSYEHCGDPDFYQGSWNWTMTSCPARRPKDVYFLVDSSASVRNLWDDIRKAMSVFITSLNPNKVNACLTNPNYDVECGDRAALVLFGGTGKDLEDDDVLTLSKLTYDLVGLADTAKHMDRLMPTPGSGASMHTWTYAGIWQVINEWDTEPMLKGNDKLFFILTDGKPDPPGKKPSFTGKANQNPCDDTNGNIAIVDELDDRQIKTIIFTIGEEFDSLNCLVDDPTKDIINVPDPSDFFDSVDDSIFCTETSPTPDPTNSPTPEPTDAPTFEPTPSPTNEPTEEPTHKPTHVPTNKPTNKPTHEPTNRPSPFPTARPTHEPTSFPTRHPTNEPTNDPTDAPTQRPSNHPTDKPTHEPTHEPTHRPTEFPTDNPTFEPTQGCIPYASQNAKFRLLGKAKHCRANLPGQGETGTDCEESPYMICWELIPEFKDKVWTKEECEWKCTLEQRCNGFELTRQGKCRMIDGKQPALGGGRGNVECYIKEDDCNPAFGGDDLNTMMLNECYCPDEYDTREGYKQWKMSRMIENTRYCTEDEPSTGCGESCLNKKNEMIRRAQANRMFHLCQNWCLFDVEDPYNTYWIWDMERLCWTDTRTKINRYGKSHSINYCKNKHVRVNNGRGSIEFNYMVERTREMCEPPPQIDYVTYFLSRNDRESCGVTCARNGKTCFIGRSPTNRRKVYNTNVLNRFEFTGLTGRNDFGVNIDDRNEVDTMAAFESAGVSCNGIVKDDSKEGRNTKYYPAIDRDGKCYMRHHRSKVTECGGGSPGAGFRRLCACQ